MGGRVCLMTYITLKIHPKEFQYTNYITILNIDIKHRYKTLNYMEVHKNKN